MRRLAKIDRPKDTEAEFRVRKELAQSESRFEPVQQVVTNLVINAEAIGEATGVIAVHTGLTRIGPEQVDVAVAMRTGDHVYIAVSGTGSGSQGQKLRSFLFHKVRGRGLGLAAVAGIVRGHRGAISVQSLKDVGSTIRVFFPVQAS